MKYIMCAVSDRAVSEFMNPFTAQSKGSAVRAFGDEVMRADSQFGKHPEDYELHALAEFDSETGVFTQSTGTMEVLARAKDFFPKGA